MPVGQLIDMTVNRAANNVTSEKPIGMQVLEPV